MCRKKEKEKGEKDKKQRGNIQVTQTIIVYYGILHAHSGHLKNIF